MFSFRLNFYNKDCDKKKAKTIQFDCFEHKDEQLGRSKRSGLQIVGFPEQDKTRAHREFDVIHVIERQIVLMWQRELERHLQAVNES